MRGPSGRSQILARLGVGVFASAAAGFLLRSSLAAAVGFFGGVTVVVALERALEWVDARHAQAILSGKSDAALHSRLSHRAAVVRAAAARRLVETRPAEEVVALLVERAGPMARALAGAIAGHESARSLAVSRIAARLADEGGVAPGERDTSEARLLAATLAELRAEESVVAPLLAAETRAPVRLALASAIAASDAGVHALVKLVADDSVGPELRESAFDALADGPRPRVATAVREALAQATDGPTVELLWTLGVAGEPADALLAARTIAAETFAVASASMGAVEEILERGQPADAAPLEAALREAREKLRTVHPPGDNRLADELVARIEDALAPRSGAA